MAELAPLGAKIVDVVRARWRLQRVARDDLYAVALQAFYLLRIVGKKAHALDTQIAYDLRSDRVVAQVLPEAELEICLDRIATAVLQCVRADLVRQPYSPPFLVHVDDGAAAGGGDAVERELELVAAIAAR